MHPSLSFSYYAKRTLALHLFVLYFMSCLTFLCDVKEKMNIAYVCFVFYVKRNLSYASICCVFHVIISILVSCQEKFEQSICSLCYFMSYLSFLYDVKWNLSSVSVSFVSHVMFFHSCIMSRNLSMACVCCVYFEPRLNHDILCLRKKVDLEMFCTNS